MHARSKCCTFYPRLTNFAVGDILRDPTALARPVVDAAIDRRATATPFGLEVPPKYLLLYRNGVQAFGKAQSMRCPYYVDEQGGLCGIWRQRSAVCSTWFCKHDRAATGQAFWRALRQLLRYAEDNVARWCALELGVPASEIPSAAELHRSLSKSALSENELDELVDGQAYAARWTTWLGKEREFYTRASELADSLDADGLLRLGGLEQTVLQRRAQLAFARQDSRALPARLEPARLSLTPLGEGSYRITTYSPHDPIELPSDLVELLGYFDGSATEDCLARIRDAEQVELDQDLVLRLVDYQVLQSVEKHE